MPRSAFLGVLALLLLQTVGSLAADVPHIANGDTPRDGRVILQLEEIWHRGHDEDDLFFGSISSVQRGPDGAVYVLDQQLSQVCVFDDAGRLLRTLSREGEGPGETRQPEHMVFLPSGNLGLAQYINGRIIEIALDGTPVGTLLPPGTEAGGSGMANIRRVRCRAGTFVINGVRLSPEPDGQTMVRTQYLVGCDDAGQPQVEYLASSTTNNLIRDGWIERNNYFPSHERWDIDRQGRLLAATERNDYRVSVFDPAGAVLLTFGRQHEPYRRSAERKQEIRDSLVVLRDGQRLTVTVDVEDAEPALVALNARPDGEIWVETSAGRHDQEPGIMMTYDVFDEQGAFIRQTAVACDGDPQEDRLFLLDEHHAALVRGAVQARRNTFGGSRGEEAEVAIHDLKVYRF